MPHLRAKSVYDINFDVLANYLSLIANNWMYKEWFHSSLRDFAEIENMEQFVCLLLEIDVIEYQNEINGESIPIMYRYNRKFTKENA